MSVIAKFFVQNVERYENSPSAAKIEMGAVCRGAENASWASATPWGSIVLGTLNEKADAYFEKGAEYLVTFERVNPPKAGDGHDPIPVDKYGYISCAFCGMSQDKEFGFEGHEALYKKGDEAYQAYLEKVGKRNQTQI